MKAPANKCLGYNKLFYICRREQDSLIFQQIKEWEQEKVGLMPETEREVYLKELKEKKELLELKLQRTAQSIGNRNLRWRIAADIEQLEWRHANLL